MQWYSWWWELQRSLGYSKYHFTRLLLVCYSTLAKVSEITPQFSVMFCWTPCILSWDDILSTFITFIFLLNLGSTENHCWGNCFMFNNNTVYGILFFFFGLLDLNFSNPVSEYMVLLCLVNCHCHCIFWRNYNLVIILDTLGSCYL